MKIYCANSECAKTRGTLSMKLGLPGAGQIKFYLEEKEKILTILTNNYPGKLLRVDTAGISPGKEEGGEYIYLDKVVMKMVEFLNAFSDNHGNDIKIDNLDNAI